MNFRNKFNLLLMGAAFFCVAASCGPKDSSRDASEGDIPEYEALERDSAGSESYSEEATEAESYTEDPAESDSYSEDASEAAPSGSGTTSGILEGAPTKGRGTWDPATQMYEDAPRHLFWDLSFFKTWNTFTQSKLPKNMMFAAEADNGVLVTVVAIPLEKSKKITSVWELPKQEVVNKLMEIQKKAFVKSVNKEPVVEKVSFRNKSAYQITFKAEIPDHRNGEKKVTNYKIQMVAVVSDNELIELEVMAPQSVIDGRYGNDILNFLIGKFNFLN